MGWQESRRFKRIAVLVAILAVTAGSGLAGCSREVRVTYPVVPSTLPLRSTTTTTIGPDRSKLPLPTLDGSRRTTTTIGFETGTASISGIVKGPEGPVAGAKVRIERFVGTLSASKVVTADAEGRYTLTNVQLGRVRVRAWRSPDLAMTSSDVLFAVAKTTHDLAVDSYDRTEVQWAIAPQIPYSGSKVNLVVQLSTRVVDDEGQITIVPLSGVGVSVYPTGRLVPLAVGEKLTNAEGRAVFTLRCESAGDGGLDVRLATGGQAVVTPPQCQDPVVTVPQTSPPVGPTDTVPPGSPTDTPTTVPTGPFDPTAPAVPTISLVPVPVVPQ